MNTHSYVELCLYYITCVQLCLHSYVELCILLCRLCDVMVMNNVLFVCNFLYLLPVSLSYLILYLSCMIYSTIDSQLI